MSIDEEFEARTTEEFAAIYSASTPIFKGILNEIRELSKKKSDATMNAGKVKMVNRVLADLLLFLKGEPAGKYLELLDDESLPQMSDAVLTMVQYESALHAFQVRYFRSFRGSKYWITHERVAIWKSKYEGDEG